MSPASRPVLVVYWEWSAGPHKGARFWGAHQMENDGRLRDWPKMDLKALGAAKIDVVEGQGLELLPPATAPEH